MIYDHVTALCNIIFFKNQQFITQHTVADCGSDYIATYMQSKLTLNYKRKEKKRNKRKETGKIKRKEISNN